MINYYKGKQMYLSVDSETQKVVTLVNETNECLMRVISPAPFFSRISEDVTNGVIEESTEEVFNAIQQEVKDRLSSL
jgi:hypothetical protein